MRGYLVRTLLVGAAVSSVGLAACGSDSKSTTTTAPAATEAMTTDAPATTDSPATTDATATTDAPATTDATATTDTTATTDATATPAEIGADGSATITVTVGTDDFDTTGGARVVSVPKGTVVTITLTDPANDQEYHLHGYDIEASAKKGEPGTLTFTADQTGQFDLESHDTEAVLLVLVVV